jgi:acid phosphatase
MLAAVLRGLAASVTPPGCVAPLVTPPPVAGMTLTFALVLTRHGARTPQTAYLPPAHRGYWVCDSDDAYAPRMHGTIATRSRRIKEVLDPRLVEFLPNCRAGDLLIQGMEQHHRLGALYGRYLSARRLLAGRPTADQLFVRATDFERTFRSAQSFLDGAFPPTLPGESITIHRGTTDAEIMRPGFDFCEDMRRVSDQYAAMAGSAKDAGDHWESVQHIADYLRVEFSEGNLSLVADWVATHDCDGKTLPAVVSRQDVADCHAIVAEYMYNLMNLNASVFVSYSMREVLRIANSSVNGQLKFSLLSSHDSTLSTFLVYLADIDQSRIPPFASHVMMEIWEDKKRKKYVRWVYNGNVLRLKNFDGKELVKYSTFALGVQDVYKYCTELP